MVDARADQGGAGDGEDPGHDDAARNAPTNGGEPTRGADADDCAGDGVRGADRNAEERVADDGEATGGFGGEASEGRELGDALAHGLDDAPAAGHRAAAHGEIAADDDPVRNFEVRQKAPGHKRSGDDAHAFLRVVKAVAEAEERRGNELEAAEPAVDSLRAHAADDPTGDDREKSGKAQADDGREEDEQDGLDPAAENKRAEAGVGDGSATVTAEECVRRAWGQAETESEASASVCGEQS